MPREHNFLLARGERLTTRVEIRQGGGQKRPPYSLAMARRRLLPQVALVERAVAALPAEACPDDEAVASITLHPRYVSKSDAPEALLASVGLRTIGTKPRRVTPERWGTSRPPAGEVVTDELFVAGKRSDFSGLASRLRGIVTGSSQAGDLTHLEAIDAIAADDKLKGIPEDQSRPLLEVALHSERRPERILSAFRQFARRHEAEWFEGRERYVPGLIFLPLRADAQALRDLAAFAFLRVLRGMPALRQPTSTPLRAAGHGPVALPVPPAHVPSIRVAVLDGGLPASPDLSQWVDYDDGPGMGTPNLDYLEHGLAVTSACLFGPLSGAEAPRPYFRVDHHRVVEPSSDFEYLDALDRIVQVLDGDRYEFAGLSLGPHQPITDDEVSSWTARLDELLARRAILLAVAVGNDGHADRRAGLNRIQSPSDGVNVLAVGAADSLETPWRRALYSCVGPGRSPGLVKPDGVAFGGDDNEPFAVLKSGAGATRKRADYGTSLAAPFTLRAAAAVRALLGNELRPLTLRALLIHRCEESDHNPREVGWGRFEADPLRLVTCEDDEALVAFQGTLPRGRWLRATVPLPPGPLAGMVTIRATLLIVPRVEPGSVSTYTRDGIEVRFRPDDRSFTPTRGRPRPQHARAASFFTESNVLGAGEHALREEGCKWEPCLRASRRMRGRGLHNPCFDIYHHQRSGVPQQENDSEIPYALIVGVRAPSMPQLYDAVVREHRGVLVQLQPRLRLQVRT